MSEEKKSPEIKQIDLPIVKKLEEASKIGFFCEAIESEEYLEPHVRLRVEGLPAVDDLPAEDDLVLTPWCSVSDLTLMLQGVLLLHPMILKVIKDRQKNAEPPKEE